MKRLNLFFVMFCIAITLGLAGPVAAADVPAPGTVINKSNIDQYKEFFPEFWIDAFKTGYGFIAPLSITIEETRSNPFPEEVMRASEANKGKYSVDEDGYIVGGPSEEISGFPFPDIKPEDPGFVTKLMWNFDYRYQFDDQRGNFMNLEKRLGSNCSVSQVDSFQISFQGRMFDDPKPLYKTAQNYRSANFIRNTAPPVQRNFITLLIRYIDQKAADTTYLYLPSMRRVLRGEAGERSTPIMSSTQAPDDFASGFAGRIPEFTYELVADTQVIGQAIGTWSYTSMKDIGTPELIPVEPAGWQVRDVYVVDVTSKSAKYPQSKKRIWLDKETMINLYACAWDRAGKLWKIWQTPHMAIPNQSKAGSTIPYFPGMLGIDLQLGYGVQMFSDWQQNGQGVTDNDISISAIRKIGR